VASAAGTIILPTIIPFSVMGKNAPSNKINIWQTGCGLIAQSHDMPGALQHDVAV